MRNTASIFSLILIAALSVCTVPLGAEPRLPVGEVHAVYPHEQRIVINDHSFYYGPELVIHDVRGKAINGATNVPLLSQVKFRAMYRGGTPYVTELWVAKRARAGAARGRRQ